MPLTTVEPTRLYRQIADQIAALIDSGEYAAGARLPAERELASVLGVSRTSVREAIICLELAGRVEVRVGTGIFVCPRSARSAAPLPSVADAPGPFELLAARQVIEGEIAALAARTIRRDDLRTLRGTMERMRQSAAERGPRDQADREFHVTIAQATGNSALRAVVNRLWDARSHPLWTRIDAHFHTPALRAKTLEDHAAIVAALEARDAQGARTAMHRHLARVIREFQRRSMRPARRIRGRLRFPSHAVDLQGSSLEIASDPGFRVHAARRTLSLVNLDRMSSPPVRRPAARPSRTAILHLGLGAFHRAHQVEFTEDALEASPSDAWGISGVSLKTPGVRDRLVAQDLLYTLVKKSPAGVERRVLGCLREALFLNDDRERVLERLTSPDTAIVSLTITEKGYGHDPVTGRLDAGNADIAADLCGGPPRSAIGLIVSALDARRQAHGKGFTVLCCDNLPHNGAVVRGLVREFASQRDPALARWIETAVTFPSTMVDRIVPATTDADIAENAAALGLEDAAPVVCEPFRQWVIEDAFVAGRPAWERAGAELVDDVAPFETMKLRLLNGSHSALAYLGFLAGHAFIYEVAGSAAFEKYMRALMAEATPTLRVPASVDLAAYQDALVARFRNPALPHRTRQIAMDGSQKLPQRLLATIRENLAAGRPIARLALAVAAWMRYVYGRDEQGGAIEVSDPLAGHFSALAAAHRGDPAGFAGALLRIEAIFGADFAHDPRFIIPVVQCLTNLFAKGAARTVQEINARPR